MSEEPGVVAKVITAAFSPNAGDESDEQMAKGVQFVMDVTPVVIQGMVETLPPGLKPPVMKPYKDENGKINWGYFPAE